MVADCLLQQSILKYTEWGAIPKASVLGLNLDAKNVVEASEDYEAAEGI